MIFGWTTALIFAIVQRIYWPPAADDAWIRFSPYSAGDDMTRRLAIALVAACLALACGGSQEDKMERGLTVDRETAAPGAAAEYDMTEAERRAKLDAEDRKKEIEEFDAAAGQ